MLGTSLPRASRRRETGEARSRLCRRRPVWETPTKPDADPPIGLEGSARSARRLDSRDRDRRDRRAQRARVPRRGRVRRRRRPRRADAQRGVDEALGARRARPAGRARAPWPGAGHRERCGGTREGSSSLRTLSSRTSTSGSTSISIGATSATARPPSTSATSPPSGAEPEAPLVTLAVPPETELDDVLALYDGLERAGRARRRRGHEPGRAVVLSVTALGRSARVPGRAGAKPGDLLVVTGPLGAAGRVPGTVVSRVLRSGSRRGGSLPHTRTRCSTSRMGSPSTRGTWRVDQASGCEIDLERVPLAEGATVEDLGFGEDFELLAAVQDPGRFAAIGRLRGGGRRRAPPGRASPYNFRGRDHFGAQPQVTESPTEA